jgi:hypothetical protein
MHFTKFYVAISLISSAIALPISGTSIARRALQFREYADFQVSDGEAGNALAEVKAKFPVRKSNHLIIIFSN